MESNQYLLKEPNFDKLLICNSFRILNDEYLKNKLIDINKIYSKLEKNVKIIYKPEYSNLVNFSENLNKARHRWFNIKEGFSSEIIKSLIKRFDGENDDLVFDPFAGSGTTLLACKELGIESFGFEVNPFLSFVGKIKLINGRTDIQKYIPIINRLKTEKGLEPPKLSISKKLFGNQLNDVLTIKKFINSIKNKNERNLLKMAFLCSLEKSNKSKKDGNGLKYPKNKKVIPIKESIQEKIKEIQLDLINLKLPKIKSNIFNKDVRKIEKEMNSSLKNYKGNVSFSIFSPPYMNCFDYTEVYKMELWFGDFIKDYKDLKILRDKSLDSHLNKLLIRRNHLNNPYVNFFVSQISQKPLWNKKIPLMIEGYFEDMWITLNGVYKLLKKDGICVIVVGNSSYGNIVVPTDLILANIGKNIGFKECWIEVARKLGTSSQQYKKINSPHLLRESLVIFKK